MSEAQPNSLDCPQCGGANRLASGERVVQCEFCAAALFVDRSGVVGHYWLPRLLDAEQAEAALRRWMAGNDTVKDLDRKSEVREVTALSFPVWLFRGRREGAESAYIEPAAPTPIPQLMDLEIPAGELRPYEPEEDARASEATIPLETARGWLSDRGVSEVFESSLVQLPLWECHYVFDGRPYVALVDGSTGAVLAAVYPEKAEAPYYIVAIVGLILFGLLGLLISNPLYKLVAYGIVGLPLALAAYWVARKV